MQIIATFPFSTKVTPHLVSFYCHSSASVAGVGTYEHWLNCQNQAGF